MKELIFRISWFKFVFYNFFSSRIERRGKGYIVPYKGAILDLSKGAKIILYDENFHICFHKMRHSRAEAYVKLLKDSQLEIKGKVVLNYNATIEIHEGAVIEVGSADINSGAVIIAANRIVIGEDVLVSRNVIVYDSDHHAILGESGERVNLAKPVVIGNHVWIGVKCTVLRGANIGEGAVIAANSLVGGKIKSGTMASGNPARSYSEIRWEK